MTQQVNNSGSQGLLLDGQHKVNRDTWWGLGTESQLSEQIWHLDRLTEGCRSLSVQHLFTERLLWCDDIFSIYRNRHRRTDYYEKQIAHSIPVRAGDLGAGGLTCGLNHSLYECLLRVKSLGCCTNCMCLMTGAMVAPCRETVLL